MFKWEVDQTCTVLYYVSYNSVKKAPRAHVTVLLVNSTLSLKNKNSEPLKTRKNYLLFSRIQKVYKSMVDKYQHVLFSFFFFKWSALTLFMNDHCRLVSTVKHPKQQSNADKSELSVSVKPLVPMGADDHDVYGRGFSCGKPPAWWLNTDSTAAGTRLHHLTDTCTQPEPEKSKQIESLKKGFNFYIYSDLLL